MRLFYLLFSLYGLSHIYVFICLRRAFGGGKWQLPVIVWLLAMATSWFFRFGRPAGPVAEKFQDVAFIWMGFLIFLCYCLIATDIAALAARLAAFITKSAPIRGLAGWLVAPRYVPAALAAALLLFCYALYEAQTPRTVTIPIRTDKMAPGSPPIRVAAIADVHISSLIGPWMLSRMAARINESAPDVLVLCGDLVDTDVTGRDEDAAVLRSIHAPLGKFVVTGNHEYYHGLQASLDFMEKSGLRPLRGETAHVGDIVIAGVDDGNFAGRFVPDTTDIMRTLHNAPDGRFILLLNHKPYYPEAAPGKFDLLFSGHTHGGQFWPGGYVTRNIYKMPQGLSRLEKNGGDSLIYISNGIGFWGPPIRFLTPPEITLFIIAPAQDEG